MARTKSKKAGKARAKTRSGKRVHPVNQAATEENRKSLLNLVQAQLKEHGAGCVSCGREEECSQCTDCSLSFCSRCDKATHAGHHYLSVLCTMIAKLRDAHAREKSLQTMKDRRAALDDVTYVLRKLSAALLSSVLPQLDLEPFMHDHRALASFYSGFGQVTAIYGCLEATLACHLRELLIHLTHSGFAAKETSEALLRLAYLSFNVGVYSIAAYYIRMSRLSPTFPLPLVEVEAALACCSLAEELKHVTKVSVKSNFMFVRKMSDALGALESAKLAEKENTPEKENQEVDGAEKAELDQTEHIGAKEETTTAEKVEKEMAVAQRLPVAKANSFISLLKQLKRLQAEDAKKANKDGEDSMGSMDSMDHNVGVVREDCQVGTEV